MGAEVMNASQAEVLRTATEPHHSSVPFAVRKARARQKLLLQPKPQNEGGRVGHGCADM